MNVVNPTNILAGCFVFASMFVLLAIWCGALALYIRTRSSWPRAWRIWVVFALCNSCIPVTGIAFGIGLYRSVFGQTPTPFIILGLVSLALGALGIMSWGKRLYVPARRQYGGP